MLLRPEIYKCWEEALKRFGNAEKLSREGKLQEAANEAIFAVLFGCQAAKELSKELKIPDLLVIADNISSDFFERTWEKHYTPKKMLEWADTALKRLSAEIPPGILRPLR